MSSKYTSRIKAKRRKRRGGAMTEEGKDIYKVIAPKSKKAAVIARKTVNTLMNHGEEMANIATALASESSGPEGGAMTEEGRDMYGAVRPISKRGATYARKGVNTLMNHGEDIATALGGDERAVGSLQNHHDK
jgi:hypothetical protein